jgi:hypothetical protein
MRWQTIQLRKDITIAEFCGIKTKHSIYKMNRKKGIWEEILEVLNSKSTDSSHNRDQEKFYRHWNIIIVIGLDVTLLKKRAAAGAAIFITKMWKN